VQKPTTAKTPTGERRKVCGGGGGGGVKEEEEGSFSRANEEEEFVFTETIEYVTNSVRFVVHIANSCSGIFIQNLPSERGD
jgi:hypothetical protein